jgi:hypothetical protein
MTTMRLHATLPLLLGLLAAVACDDPTGTGGTPGDYLAGGGRALSDDSFVGGREASGPVARGREPTKPDVAPGFPAIFYSELNCFEKPFEGAIRSAADWQTWWKTATSCQPTYDPPPVPPDQPKRTDGTGSTDPGSTGTGSTDPVKPERPPVPGGPPVVDFVRSAVITIGLESAKGWGRRLQVVDVSPNGRTTTVRYQVLTPGEDCTRLLMAPFDPDAVASAPVTAVLVRAPLGERVVFERKDAVWHCVVEPDPKTPLTLYYTDAQCDLGEGEAIIREAARWKAWLSRAVDCERPRWETMTEPGLPKDLPVTRTADATSTIEPRKGWLSPTVDFSTHAVVILRAPVQNRWGGGVWLTGIRGSTIGYTVMTPGRSCPVVEGGLTVRPTAAIRVPLPLREPVTFRRSVETIDCRWKREPVPMSSGSSAGDAGTPTTTAR